MPTAITTPDAVPGEVIEAAWGDAVRTDLTTLGAAVDWLVTNDVRKTGDTMTGMLTIGTTGGGPSLSLRAANPYLDLSSEAGARYAYLMGRADGLMLDGDGLGNIVFMSSSGERMRMTSGRMLVGKAASNLDSAGVEMPLTGSTQEGRIDTTVWNVPSCPNLYARHMGTADAHGQPFSVFNRTGGTHLGSVTQVNTTGVAFNTTSDKRLKRLTRIVDGDEAIDKLSAVEPVNFVYVDTPEVGEQTGFFAQDLHTVAPEAVTVGSGEPGDDEFVPWMVDRSALVPTLVAAVQALTRRVTALEGTPA